jgi:hypothetical protein
MHLLIFSLTTTFPKHENRKEDVVKILHDQTRILWWWCEQKKYKSMKKIQYLFLLSILNSHDDLLDFSFCMSFKFKSLLFVYSFMSFCIVNMKFMSDGMVPSSDSIIFWIWTWIILNRYILLLSSEGGISYHQKRGSDL